MQKNKDFKATAKMSDVFLKIGGSYSWEDNSSGYDPKRTYYIEDNGCIDGTDTKEVASAYLTLRSLGFQTARAETEGNYSLNNETV